MIEMSQCPVEVTVHFLANRWRVLILRELLQGPRRFTELHHGVSAVSQKVLTSNLRAMEEAGLLTRTVYAEVPPRVVYELTDIGYSLRAVLDAMYLWGEQYQHHNPE